MKDIKSEVYKALANIMFETGASKEDMNEAIEWFNEKFYEDEVEVEDEDNEESAEMKFEEGQIYEADTNIFIKAVDGNVVYYIEGISPAAVHSIQVIRSCDLIKYIKENNFKRADSGYEAFVNRCY